MDIETLRLLLAAEQAAIATPSSANWSVVLVHRFKELIAVENLKRQGFAAYCPHVWKQIRHSRQCKTLRRPLFPGYVFVNVAAEFSEWRPILSTIGIRDLVRLGRTVARLPNGFVECLKACETDGVVGRALQHAGGARNAPQLGGRQRGFVATLIELEEEDRLTALTLLLDHPALPA